MEKKASMSTSTRAKLIRQYISAGSLLLTALLFIFGGIAFLIWYDKIPMLMNTVVAIYAIGSGAIELLTCISKFHWHRLLQAVTTLVVGLVLLAHPLVISGLYPFFFGIYILILAAVKLISYLTYRKNKIPGRIMTLISGIIMVLLAVPLVLDPLRYLLGAMIFTAVFCIFYGLTQLGDFIKEVAPMQQTDKIKRRIRIGLPVFLASFFPKKSLDYINSLLSTSDDGEVDEESFKSADSKPNLEIFVHVTESGTGAMGHCDLYYNGRVYCYGCYDYTSSKLFGCIGDGVLFTDDNRDEYIDFCAKATGDSIFAFGLLLNEHQLKLVDDCLAELLTHVYPWKSILQRQHEGELPITPIDNRDYASRAYRDADVKLYKFNDTSFKTYFVLNTNCVMLVDHIVGASGCDILSINGIITPGTYYEYLDKQYHMRAGSVVSRQTYHHSAKIDHV